MKVKRPWGCYEVLSTDKGFQTKLLHVSPGGVLSLQSHTQRDERWTVVQGIATAQVDGETKKLRIGETMWVPRTIKHRLSNNTDREVKVIEVQIGEYTGEDDIIRYEDRYNRHKN